MARLALWVRRAVVCRCCGVATACSAGRWIKRARTSLDLGRAGWTRGNAEWMNGKAKGLSDRNTCITYDTDERGSEKGSKRGPAESTVFELTGIGALPLAEVLPQLTLSITPDLHHAAEQSAEDKAADVRPPGDARALAGIAQQA